MLFNYRYVPHDIEQLHQWLEHLVKQVWCRNEGEFSLSLLCPELRQIIIDLGNDDSVSKDHFDGPIKTLDARFQTLSQTRRQQISAWFDHNNDIEALCANDPNKQPCTYNDLPTIDSSLATNLKTFCQNLFTNVINLSAVQRQLGCGIGDHYKAFMSENDEGKCPYCGINDLKGVHHSKREAYDHFLPKGTYPFNSVNFRNLAPMCHECNSSYKLQKKPLHHLDPIRKKEAPTRRKAFFSYDATPSQISVSLELNPERIDRLEPCDITLTISSPGREEEVEGWKEVYGIDERYKAKCGMKNDGKYWLTQALDECANTDGSISNHLSKITRAAESHPWAEVNFLKKPFLDACERAGVFRAATRSLETKNNDVVA